MAHFQLEQELQSALRLDTSLRMMNISGESGIPFSKSFIGPIARASSSLFSKLLAEFPFDHLDQAFFFNTSCQKTKTQAKNSTIKS